jgi:hypothetical protein
MFDEPSLRAALADVGYRRVKRHLYRAEWSTEIEHFIEFHLYGTPKDYLAADFGLRNKEAETFADRSIKAYGGPWTKLIRYDEQTDFCIRFSLGKLAGSWGLRSSLTISSMPGPLLAKKVRDDIEQKLFPLIRDVTSLSRFMSLLATDIEPFAWLYSNAAMRAAMIVSVAQRLGATPDDVRPLFEPHFKGIAYGISDGRNPDPRAYIDNIMRDAASRDAPNSMSASRT